MSHLEDVYQALVEGQRAADHLRNIARGVDAWDRVRSRERVLADGMKAFERLRQEMSRRPIYNEPPEDFKRTSCGCQDPGMVPPCSWCTDPDNDPDGQPEANPIPSQGT